MIEENRNICYLCKCEKTKTDNIYNLKQCLKCSFIWQYDIRKKMDYSSRYFDYYKKLENNDRLLIDYIRLDLIHSNISKEDITKNNTILDIGYGIGSFIRSAEKQGFDCYGYDVHHIENGIKRIDNLNNVGIKFNIVTAFDSIEHMMFEEIKSLFNLKPRYFIFSTPFAPDNIEDMINWKHFKPNEHLSYFNENNFKMLLENNGYKVIYYDFPEDNVRKGNFNIQTIIGVNKSEEQNL